MSNMIKLDEDSFIKNDTRGYILFTRKDGKFKGDGEDEEDILEEVDESGPKPDPNEKEAAFRKTFHNKVSHAIISHLHKKKIESSELSEYVQRLEDIEKRLTALDYSILAQKGKKEDLDE